jgi:hypothetical protein
MASYIRMKSLIKRCCWQIAVGVMFTDFSIFSDTKLWIVPALYFLNMFNVHSYSSCLVLVSIFLTKLLYSDTFIMDRKLSTAILVAAITARILGFTSIISLLLFIPMIIDSVGYVKVKRFRNISEELDRIYSATTTANNLYINNYSDDDDDDDDDDD